MAKYDSLIISNDQKVVVSSREEFVGAISSERPDLTPFNPQFPTQGQMALTTFFGKEVFKAPSHPGQIEQFDCEMSSLTHMQGRTTTPIPLVTYIGKKAHFFGMRKMSGERLTPDFVAKLSPHHRGNLASDLATFMLDMRSSFTPEDVARYRLRALTFHVTPQMFDDSLKDPAVQRALGPDLMRRTRFIEHFYAAQDFRSNQVLTHGDIKDENLLVDKVNGRLTGIIDFGLVGLRQPAQDLSKLGNMPRVFLEDISRQYEAGGGGTINVDHAIAQHAAAKITDYSIQLKHEDLAAFREPTLDSLRRALGNFGASSGRPIIAPQKNL